MVLVAALPFPKRDNSLQVEILLREESRECAFPSEVFASIQALTAPCALTKQRGQDMFSSSPSLLDWAGRRKLRQTVAHRMKRGDDKSTGECVAYRNNSECMELNLKSTHNNSNLSW